MISLVCCIIFIRVYLVETVIVCPTFLDYYTYKINKNCYDNPDGESNFPSEIITRWGFHNQIYTVTTEDGYILSVERLFKDNSQKTPVIMGHGATANSMAFIDLGNKSLAFFLTNEGYDVWLINWRGTRFSRGHISLSPTNPKFWQTGFHDMAVYDLKTISNLVYAKTEKKAIYIGFSMGSPIALIYNIKEQISAEKTLKTIIHLAPVVTFQYSTSLVKSVLSNMWPFLKLLIHIVWNGEVVPYNKYLTFFCSPFPLNIKICESIAQLSIGINHNIDPLTYPVTNIQIRDSVTSGVLDHYVQIMRSNRFEELSYGNIENLKKYHQINPPLYEFSELTIPQIMFIGEKDILGSAKDAKNVYNQIPNSSKCGYHVVKNFGHYDFIMSKGLVEDYYYKLLNAIKEADSGLCKHD